MLLIGEIGRKDRINYQGEPSLRITLTVTTRLSFPKNRIDSYYKILLPKNCIDSYYKTLLP